MVGVMLNCTIIISYPINIIQIIIFLTNCNLYYTYFIFEALGYKNNSMPLIEVGGILHENDNNTSSCTSR